MNKSDLIEALATRLEGDKKSANQMIDAFVDLVQWTVQKGDKVSIAGFGVFEKRPRAARTARNPATGESIKVKKTNVPAFRPGSEFKGIVGGAIKPTKATKSTATKSTASKSTAAKSTRAAAGAPAAKRTTAAKTTAASTAKRTTAAKSTAAKSTTARSTAAKSTTAKSTAAKKTTGAAKKTTSAAKKTTAAAKKTTSAAKKTTARKAPAKASR